MGESEDFCAGASVCGCLSAREYMGAADSDHFGRIYQPSGNHMLYSVFIRENEKIFSSSILALVFLFLPLLLYIMANGNVGNWLRCLLPSSGVGLNNSLTYALLDTKFVFAGDMAVWIPFVMVGAAAVETVVFFLFAVRDWCGKSKG